MPYEYLPREANGLNTMRLCIQESSEMVPAISSTDNKLDNMMPPRKANASCLPDNRHGDQGNQAEERQYRCRRIPDAMLHGNLR